MTATTRPTCVIETYARLGWPLIANFKGSKKPAAGRGWGKAPPLTPDQARAVLVAGQNLGVRLGLESGVVDVEADSPQAERAARKLLGDVATPTFKSRRGLHRIFQFDPALAECKSSTPKLSGVEFRLGCNGKATQSLLPPSTTDGHTREWLSGLSPADLPLAPLPPEVIEKLVATGKRQNGKRGKPSKKSAGASDGGPIPEGERNVVLTSLGGAMRRQGMTQEEIEAGLLAVNRRRCQPPLTEPEVRTITSSVAQYKPDDTSIDPYPVAVQFLAAAHNTADDVLTLHWWRGDWWTWSGKCWQPVPDTEVRAKLVHYLAEQTSVKSYTLTNVMQCIQALCLLPSTMEQPSWLDDGPGPWPAAETLATADGLRCMALLGTTKGRKAQPHRPGFFHANALPFKYDPKARCPLWRRFLRSLWPDDPQSIAMLQEFVGYLVTNNTRQQKILLIVGPTRSGKGVIGRVAAALVGHSNMCGPTLASLSTNFGLSNLLNKSLAVISDARLSSKTDSSVVVERLLSISGEDFQTIDRKYRESVTTKLPTRIVLLTNELPKFLDSSGALASRFLVLQLTISWLGREDIKLTDRLLTELPGILTWGVEGLRRCLRRGHFTQPRTGRPAVKALEDIASPVGAFVRERCHVGPEYEVPIAKLYFAWRLDCENKAATPAPSRFSAATWRRVAGVENLQQAGQGRKTPAAIRRNRLETREKAGEKRQKGSK